jgi:hypothetical protein
MWSVERWINFNSKKYLSIINDNRKVYAFDSFEGLPKPNDELDYTIKEKNLASNICGVPNDVNNNCQVSLDEFYETMKMCELENNDIIVKKGWFKDTCLNFNEKISILRFDGDWYESTIDVLENLYDKVVDGGVLIFDDYGYWNGNKKAVDDFMRDKPSKNYIFTDEGEMWFIK